MTTLNDGARTRGRRNERKAAILVMERGSLWPGRSLDWAEHVSVVLQSTRLNTELTLRRVRRAVDARAVKLRTLECIALTFADIADQASYGYRSDLVNGLGAVLVEAGCRRLVLAAYHTERLDPEELMALLNVAPCNVEGRFRVEVAFHRVSPLRSRQGRVRR